MPNKQIAKLDSSIVEEKEKMQRKYCIHQKDGTLPKASKVVEKHAFSEWNFTERTNAGGITIALMC